MKKRIISLIFLSFVMLLTGCNKKETTPDALHNIIKRDKIIVGVKYDTKPFGYLENNRLVGYDIDLAKLIAKNLLGDENKIEFKYVTPSNRIYALNADEVDMVIATMTITGQRKAVIDFSIPYFVTGQSILVPKDSKITSIADLNGKKVIIVYGSTAEKNLRIAAPDASIIGFKTYMSAYNALKNGWADAMTSDYTILVGLALADKQVKLLPKKYSQEPYAIGFKKDSSTQRLKNEVNRILSTLDRQGELNALKKKWIKQ